MNEIVVTAGPLAATLPAWGAALYGAISAGFLAYLIVATIRWAADRVFTERRVAARLHEIKTGLDPRVKHRRPRRFRGQNFFERRHAPV